MAGAPKGAFVVISKISHSDISCIIKNSPAFARPYRKPPQKIRGAIISILPVSLYRFKDVLFNYIAYRINRRFVKIFIGKNLGQTCAKRNLRFLCTPACHAWQALRKVLLSIFRKIASDTSRIITRTLDSRAVVVHQGFCFLNIFLQGVLCVSYTLKRKLTTSPSFMTYSLPSERRKPFSLAAAREPPTSMSLS